MRRVTLLLVALGLLSFTLPAGAKEKAGLKNGFRDLNWGSKPTEEMKLTGTNPRGCNLYQRPGDVMMLGDALLAAITYTFCNGGFTSVQIEAKPVFGETVLEELSSIWGAGKKRFIARGKDQFTWGNGDTEAVLTVTKHEMLDSYYWGDLVIRSRSREKSDDARKKRRNTEGQT